MIRRWIVLGLSSLVLVGGSPVSRSQHGNSLKPWRTPPEKQGNTETTDPRVEALARIICKVKGIDPDHEGSPYPPGPVWKYFIPDAELFIEQYDAAEALEKLKQKEQRQEP